MTPEQARDQFSDYLEDALDPAARDALQAHLARHPALASELIALERTVSVLHRLPSREPSLDLWREFAPLAEAYKAERRLPLSARLRLHWELLSASVGEGILVWTHALSERAHRRWGSHAVRERRRAEQ